MREATQLNDIANGRFQKKPSMTMTMPLNGAIREEPLEEELVDARADDIISRIQGEKIRPLICDIARYIKPGYIEWAIKMSLMPGIRCPAARFNSLCFKHLQRSQLYGESVRKRQYYRRLQTATA